MRLLVTRPEPDAAETARRLAARGHDVLVAPMLVIRRYPPPAAVRRPAGIVLTSRNAVRALDSWPEAAEWHDRPVYAVGAETAAEARALGFADVIAGDGGVEALRRVIMSRHDADAGPLLYPAARDRAGRLERDLGAAGFAVDLVEAYAAEAADTLDRTVQGALGAGTIDGVLLFSRRSAEIFVGLVIAAGLAEAARSAAYLAISDAVAEALAPLERPESGLRLAVRVAARPDAEAVLALVTGPDAKGEARVTAGVGMGISGTSRRDEEDDEH